MARQLQIKRGLKAGMPTLAQGELAMTIDAGSEGVFIGTGTENIELARKSDLDAIPTPDVSGQIGTHNSDSSAHSDIRSSITAHTGDTSIHVTSDQKTAWDAKATTSYVDQKISEIPTPDVSGQISTHNTNTEAHNDIRELITGLTTRLNALADSDDATLDQLSEIVAYIKNNKSLIDGITTSKVNVSDIIDNLTTNITNKPLSAAQGVALKALIDAITVPTKVSELTNDSGYLTSFTETDPTVPAWAKAASKPTYTASEVGLGNVGNFKAVSTVASQGLTDTEKSNARANIGAGTSSLTIGTTASTAAAGNHTHTAANVGAVPTSRKINGKALSSDITLSASDVSARPSSWTPSASDVGAVPTSRTVNGKALSTNITLSASDVGAAPASHTSDSTVHVTSEEKTAWNAKADAPFKPAGKSYLTFSSPNSFTLKVNDTTKHWNGTLEYFTSNKTWTTWNGTTTISSVDNDGEHVLYLRGTGNTVITGNSTDYGWVLTGSDISCIGNIEYLLDYATVESGNHPTMATRCYQSMFYNCTSLTQAPALPATTLSSNCYDSMFSGCTSLTQAPALPATTLAEGCYSSMFGGCTSLTQAPALPATTLATYCYPSMFNGCTNLAQAPALPATTLSEGCYQTMFSGCTSLTQAPALPATTLVPYCYQFMFQNCTSLTQAPALPATTLPVGCYYGMFNGCTSLKLSATQTGEYTVAYRIPMTGTGTTASEALTSMFDLTGGTFTGTPEINTTYYLSSDNMIVRDTEVATLNGYVASMIDAAYSYGTEDLEAGTSSLETGKLYFVYG